MVLDGFPGQQPILLLQVNALADELPRLLHPHYPYLPAAEQCPAAPASQHSLVLPGAGHQLAHLVWAQHWQSGHNTSTDEPGERLCPSLCFRCSGRANITRGHQELEHLLFSSRFLGQALRWCWEPFSSVTCQLGTSSRWNETSQPDLPPCPHQAGHDLGSCVLRAPAGLGAVSSGGRIISERLDQGDKLRCCKTEVFTVWLMPSQPNFRHDKAAVEERNGAGVGGRPWAVAVPSLPSV